VEPMRSDRKSPVTGDFLWHVFCAVMGAGGLLLGAGGGQPGRGWDSSWIM